MSNPESSRLVVRDAQAIDRDVIVLFNARLATETEGKQLDLDVLRRGVDLALAEPDRLRYWVAELAGEVVGQTAVTREWSDWRNGWIWWLQSVYVREDARARGVFRALFQRIHSEAFAAPDVIGLRLYVENENTRAQAIYQALGLNPGGYHVLEEFWAERFRRADG